MIFVDDSFSFRSSDDSFILKRETSESLALENLKYIYTDEKKSVDNRVYDGCNLCFESTKPSIVV